MLPRKKSKHTPSGYSLFTNCSFNPTKNKLDCYKGEDCMERICREYAIKIIDYEKKEMAPFTYKKISLIKSKIFVTYAKKNLVLVKM